jgi:hypothetical protein
MATATPPPVPPRDKARLDPWNDTQLTPTQRVAAALAAGLALGERLATVLPGTSAQAAWADGWHAGWAAAEHDMAEHWRHQARQVARNANSPSYAELRVRRGEAAHREAA